MRIYKTLVRRIEEDFLTLEKEAIDDLKDTDLDYSLLIDEIETLTKQYPFLTDFIAGNETGPLSPEAQKAVKEYLRLLRWKDLRERRHLYFLGHSDAIAYLKKTQMDR